MDTVRKSEVPERAHHRQTKSEQSYKNHQNCRINKE